jgi:hypothetical protein
MKMTRALLVGVGTAMLLPALAFATTADFSGYADHNGSAPGQYAVGVTYEAYTTLNAVQLDPWYPFDQAFFEYTLVIQATVSSWSPLVFGILNFVEFSPATFAIYEDNGSAADYANKATFTDGNLILSGQLTGVQGENAVPGPSYNVSGNVEITGGSGIGSVSCTELLMNDFITFGVPPSNPPASYEEGYDPQWICTPTGVEDSSWGHMKGLYR